MPDNKQWAYLVLRSTMGSVFLFHGISKFQAGVGAFAASLGKHFSNSWLPVGLVHLFGIVLPFAESILGTLLLLGAFTGAVLVLLGLLLVALTLGNLIVISPDTIAHNLIYSLAVFVLLFFAEYNVWTFEGWWTKRTKGHRLRTELGG